MLIMPYPLRPLLRFACLVCLITSAYAQTATPAYKMGAEDKLKVRVVDWRTGTYDTHEWPALTGEFTVGASGTVSFPIVGDLVASGKTPTELATSIAVSLREKVGLARDPYASVEVVRYRPFYVIGTVGKPGEYPFKPGLTVLQAVGVGGGFERTNDEVLFSVQREILTGRGDIHVLEVERLQNLVRQARIDAELREADVVRWPGEFPLAGFDATKAMKEEESLLAAHNASIRGALKENAQNKELLRKQLVSLAAKGGVLDRQESLTQQELAVVSSLVARGLVGTPRQIALQQNQAQLHSSRLDLELATLKAGQEINQMDRDSVDIVAKNRSLLLAEKAELRTRVVSIVERISSLKALVNQAEARAPSIAANLDGTRLITTYTLTREVDGEILQKSATETDFVAPGDTLTVEQHRDDARAVASAAR